MARKETPVIAVAGWKNSGKTTLVTKLVAHFSGKGLRVATIKHSHHEPTFDARETDSARHIGSGAAEVAIVSPMGLTIMPGARNPGEPGLDEAIRRLGPADLIIVEGYKSATIPKIEVRRRAQADGRPLAGKDPHVIAIASDHAVEEANVPVFSLDDIEGLAAAIDKKAGPLVALFGRAE